MKRIVFALAFIPLLLFSCGNDYSDKDRPDKAAIYYVKCAAEGHYDDYLKGMLSSEDASESYVRNMRTLIRQMVNEKKQAGLKSLKEIICERTETGDGDDTSALVYLRLTYQNDSTEHVLLPLIWAGGEWRMR